jgi:hypothetical protein
MPKGKTTFNNFEGNTYFGMAIADVDLNGALEF